jgi:hypothetical protein
VLHLTCQRGLFFRGRSGQEVLQIIVNALAGVIDGAAARLRMQLAAESDPPALTHGEVEGAEVETTPAANGKGRKAKATA